ncbi:LysE family translocator [Neotabrizicola sp. VNH66]|uniref:LysE family translocator n=1 Tax=Neotabrizicola sp. VNH66 TaxID=3400918 RepID=UPI003BFB3FD3
MGIETLAAAVLAGMIYVLVPGPATLATLSLSATRGRGAALRFLAAHLAGDVTWAALALMALAGVSRLSPGLFDALGLACGAYLVWLGVKALRSTAGQAAPVVADPVRAGLAFGLTNPKAYPFALAMLTALLGRDAAALTLPGALSLLGACTAGFILADLIVVFWTGLAPVRRLYRRFATPIGRAMGVLFIAFGLKSAADAVHSFWGRA